ncbi:hypothetical protein KDN24_07185 [Bacillus sp. Bva_UNVM-123]|uniref:hypothetical protein n=1 Tax=Bacillus sp. Bva_UNVM-123 TaxID=2829798 RepID=UPI00391F71A5
MLNKWSKSVLKLLWVVGLFGLIIIDYHIEQTVKQTVDRTFNTLPLIWFNSIEPFLFGVYISLLFLKGRSFKINKSLLLCVTLPCLFISLYIPIVSTIASNATFSSYLSNEPPPLWLFKLTISGITPIVAGLTLFVGLFQTTQTSKINTD